MKNNEFQPTRTKLFSEANVVNFNHGHGRGCGWTRDRDRERNNYYFCADHSSNPNFKRTTQNDDHKVKAPQNKNSKSD